MQPIGELREGTTDYIEVERFENQFMKDEVLLEREYVKFDYVNGSITCSCRCWENLWVICRHTLRVLDAYSAFRNPFCHSIPPMYIKDRWCKEYKRSASCSVAAVRDESHRCATFGERSRQVSAIVAEAGSTIFYNDVAYDIMLRWFLHGIKEAKMYLGSNSHTKEPVRAECSTLPVDENTKDFPWKKIKKRQNPNRSKIRLMSESEKRHLMWKQQRKLAIELERRSSLS